MDITSLLEEKTGTDTLTKLDVAGLGKAEVALAEFLQAINVGVNAISTMRAIAQQYEGYEASLDAELVKIFDKYNADCIGLVHYSDINACNVDLEAYLKTWQAI